MAREIIHTDKAPQLLAIRHTNLFTPSPRVKRLG
jgi:hypothetical protein